MIKKIIELLNNHKDVDEFLISKLDDSSKELFFIKDQLQMTRGKDVENITITLYKNFEENGIKYKGSSSIDKVSTLTTEEELIAKIDSAIEAAAFVKNEYYDLESPTTDKPKEITSAFNDGLITTHIANLVKDLFSEDKDELAFINSCEFFIHKRTVNIFNSNNVDISYKYYYGEIELVTEAGDVELFDVLHFSDYDPNWIKETVKDALLKTKLRVKAIPLPEVKDIPVILTGSAVKSFFNYYIAQASGGYKYQGIIDVELNKSVYQDGFKGDDVSINFLPELKNSTKNSYYDSFGTFLKPVEIIKDGIVKRIHSSKKIADYLNIEATGTIGNIQVEAGSLAYEDMIKEPYLMPLSFSAFQMDPMTGNFGGEIRLAIYFDGTKEIPVTLCSASSNIKLVEKDMRFSIETGRQNNFLGPKYIKVNGMGIVGN